MINCFNQSGAKLVKFDIEASSKVKTDDSLEEVVTKLFNGSGYKGIYTVNSGNEFTELKYFNEKSSIRIKAKKIYDDNTTYISFLLSQTDENKNIINMRRTISDAFWLYKNKPSFSSLIQGKYDGKLSISEMKNISTKVFKDSGASFVKGIDDGKMMSMYGFVPGFQDIVETFDKRVNLNIAMRYSKADGCTYIWIGSPIILEEY
jgi:hypothetical protein